MSYILEALKKAQAERQLGNAPTIHAPVVHAVPAARASRVPLAIGVAAAVVLLGVALFMWRQFGPAAPARVAAKAVHAPAPVPAPVVPPVATVTAALSPQVALLPEPVAQPARKSEPPARKPDTPAREAVKPEPARAAAGAPDPLPAAPARPSAEETTRGFNDLPEAVRRDVPKVTFGGYIYSPNPADRLLLVDKMLRREGEEVAPGLVLEKLLPNAAVMNYRGQRYRVSY